MTTPADEQEGDAWALTTLDLSRELRGARHTVAPHKAHDSDEDDDEDDGEGVTLTPFRAPPLPRRVAVRTYYSLEHNSIASGSGMCMPAWQRRALLSRLRRAEGRRPSSPPLDEARFQQRLSRARAHNSPAALRAAQERMAAHDAADAAARAAAFARDEARRDAVYYRHTHLLRLRALERFVRRARLWYVVVVAHVFLTALLRARRVQRALDALSRLLAPMVRRYVAVRRRRRAADELTRRHLRDIPPPTPELIQRMHGTFFDGWPPLLLERLVQHATPAYHRAGAYLMHEGDVGRNMFIVTVGELSIVLRKKGRDKRRSKANSIGVIAVHAPCYVGEFALVCKEPRSASIVCETDVGLWSVLPEHYDAVARLLSPAVASRQREATDVRRRQNLQKFFPLRLEALRRVRGLAHFADDSLTSLMQRAEPLVLHDGDYVYKAGDVDTSVYFIQDGVAMRHAAGEASDSSNNNNNGGSSNGKQDAKATEASVTRVSPGTCLGLFDCVCGVNAAKSESIVSVNYCDVWRLRREAVVEVGLCEPEALLRCRAEARAQRARELPASERVVPSCLRRDAYMSFCLPASCRQRVCEVCVPRIFLHGEHLTSIGHDLHTLFVLIRGSVDVTVVRDGEAATQRLRVDDATTTTAAAAAAAATAPHAASRRAAAAATAATSAARTLAATMASATSGALGFVTSILGACEFAAELPQYACTAVSVGVTEAYALDAEALLACLPHELRTLLRGGGGAAHKARELVLAAYTQGDVSLLAQHEQYSFAALYKQLKEREATSKHTPTTTTTTTARTMA